jgi:hypothetical protein
LSEPLEVSCITTTKFYNSSLLETNIQKAIESEDFTPVDDIIRFLPGEQNKVKTNPNIFG